MKNYDSLATAQCAIYGALDYLRSAQCDNQGMRFGPDADDDWGGLCQYCDTYGLNPVSVVACVKSMRRHLALMYITRDTDAVLLIAACRAGAV